jgi:hypothetical protein
MSFTIFGFYYGTIKFALSSGETFVRPVYFRYLNYSSVSVGVFACCGTQHNGVVGIAQSIQSLRYGPVEWEIVVRFPAETKVIFLLPNVQTGFGTHPACCSMGTGGFPPKSTEVGAWSMPITSTQFRGKEWVELYLCSFICLPDVHGDHLPFITIWSIYLELTRNIPLLSAVKHCYHCLSSVFWTSSDLLSWQSCLLPFRATYVTEWPKSKYIMFNGCM